MDLMQEIISALGEEKRKEVTVTSLNNKELSQKLTNIHTETEYKILKLARAYKLDGETLLLKFVIAFLDLIFKIPITDTLIDVIIEGYEAEHDSYNPVDIGGENKEETATKPEKVEKTDDKPKEAPKDPDTYIDEKLTEITTTAIDQICELADNTKIYSRNFLYHRFAECVGESDKELDLTYYRR